MIQLRGVSKRFGKSVVLEDVNLDIPDGKIFGLIGINGSGKTTLLKLLIGFYEPDSGTIYFQGRPIHQVLDQVRHLFGFTTQESSFYPKLTVEENIRYFGSLYGLPKKIIKANMERILPLVELDHARNVQAGKLSGGMQRRLDMACSLIHDPKVLILDEPTEDLDPPLRKEIIALIKKINGLNTTIILTSHLLGDVEQLCDVIAILHEHRVLHVSSAEELRKLSLQVDEVHIETAQGVYDGMLEAIGKPAFRIEHKVLIIPSSTPNEVLDSCIGWIREHHERLVGAGIERPSLEKIFTAIAKKPEGT